MSRDLSQAYGLIRKWEGCRLTAYPDPATGGAPWTIGYGSTVGVHPGMHITLAQAESLMEMDVQHRSAQLSQWIHVPVSDNELCAIISLAYNVGLGAVYHSQLLADLNAGKPPKAVSQDFMHFIHAAGHVMQGLVNRRKDEISIFLS
jgi:lysozyme